MPTERRAALPPSTPYPVGATVLVEHKDADPTFPYRVVARTNSGGIWSYNLAAVLDDRQLANIPHSFIIAWFWEVAPPAPPSQPPMPPETPSPPGPGDPGEPRRGGSPPPGPAPAPPVQPLPPPDPVFPILPIIPLPGLPGPITGGSVTTRTRNAYSIGCQLLLSGIATSSGPANSLLPFLAQDRNTTLEQRIVEVLGRPIEHMLNDQGYSDYDADTIRGMLRFFDLGISDGNLRLPEVPRGWTGEDYYARLNNLRIDLTTGYTRLSDRRSGR